MDGARFDHLIRTAATSRRPLVRGLAAVGLSGLLARIAPHDDAKAKKKKGKGKHKNKKQEPCYQCVGCCDASGQCQFGFSSLACGSFGLACEVCAADQLCDQDDGRNACCVPLGGNCAQHRCCKNRQCFESRCCIPIGGSEKCSDRDECCTGDCVDGTCCLFEDFECLTDDDCCGNLRCKTESPGKFVCCPPSRECEGKCCPEGQTCLRLPFSTAFVCCPEDRQCGGRCCTDTKNRIFNQAGDCACCEPPKEKCEGSLATNCCDPATQQCCEETGMCCGLSSTCIPGQLGCNL